MMPSNKPFPWRCPTCSKREINLNVVDFKIDVKHDGRLHKLHLPRFSVPKCASCGELILGNDADDQIQAALREHLNLLSPNDIRVWREKLDLTQRQLGSALGIAHETISRWESGALIQSRANDNLMRLFFGVPLVREVLTDPGQKLLQLGYRARTPSGECV